MSNLETLKAQHPDFLTRWDRSTVDGFMETTIIGGYVRHEDAAALLALVQQHEATIAELNNRVLLAESAHQDDLAMWAEVRGFVADLYAERGQDARVAYLCNRALALLKP